MVKIRIFQIKFFAFLCTLFNTFQWNISLSNGVKNNVLIKHRRTVEFPCLYNIICIYLYVDLVVIITRTSSFPMQKYDNFVFRFNSYKKSYDGGFCETRPSFVRVE